MANQGYIKLYRKIKDKNWWLRRGERATWTQAFIDLLLRANHKDAEIVLDGKNYKILRGSCVVSQRKLAKEWNWGVARVNAFFKFLVNTEQAIKYKTEHGFTHIFILNWEKYQGKVEWQVEHKVEQKRNADGTSAETNNNDKNVKKIHSSEPSSPVKEIISFFRSQVKEKRGFEPEISWAKDGKLVKQRLTKYKPDQLKDLISWYLESKHSERLGISLATCLSAFVINLWLEDTI